MDYGKLFEEVKKITPDEVKGLIREKTTSEYCLLDVRQPKEYEAEHIPGARLIPLGDLAHRKGEMDTSRQTIVYCRSGSRSSSAAGMLLGAGFKDVYNMQGGMLAYRGFVATGSPEAGAFCFPDGMSPAELIAMAWVLEDGTGKFYEGIGELEGAEVLIRNLMAAEVSHKATLGKLFAEITGEEPREDFPAGVLDKPPGDIMEGCIKVSEALKWAAGRGLAELLEFMMSLEANALDLYLKMSRKVPSEAARKVFDTLSKEEQCHIEKLASALEEAL